MHHLEQIILTKATRLAKGTLTIGLQLLTKGNLLDVRFSPRKVHTSGDAAVQDFQIPKVLKNKAPEL